MSVSVSRVNNSLHEVTVLDRTGVSSKSEIIEAVKTYVNRSNTQYAIMIDGGWGTGKTYFYQSDVKPLIKNHHSVYISLFGLKSTQDIEDEIFKAIALPAHEGENRQDEVNVSPELLDIVKIAGSGFAVKLLINQWKESSAKSGAPFVLCLDDLERWAGDLSVCLSYINKLVEHENAKCILIGNLSVLNGVNQVEFEAAKDKTVGHTYRLDNSHDEVFKAALSLIDFKNDKSNRFIEKLIADNKIQLASILEKANYKNIRTVSEAIQLFEFIFNHNSTALSKAKTLSFYYFSSLLSTLILLKEYFVSYELRDKLLNNSNSVNRGYAYLSEFGYFDENSPEYITVESKFLLETIFFRADKISLTGLFSIVQKGFYLSKDFANDFQKWEPEKNYEIYLDTYSLSCLEDTDVEKIIHDVLDSIFVKKEITNPATLLLLAESLLYDIKHGVIKLSFKRVKNQFISLIKELYYREIIDKSVTYDFDIGGNGFNQCRDVYDLVKELNNDYVKDIEDHKLSRFWSTLSSTPNEAVELFNKFKHEPIFSIYYNPQEVIDALKGLNNAQLFELVGWISSRYNDPECMALIDQEREQARKIGESICYHYEKKYGMQAKHLKKIAKLLMQ